MTQELTINDDGWSDAAAETNERLLRGTLLKFSDWNWSRGKEAQPLQRGTRLVALATAAAWVRWKDGKPIEARMRETGKKLAERDELGDTDEAHWDKLANDGHDTRSLQHYLGHKNIQHTVRYTELSPDRFKDFWR